MRSGFDSLKWLIIFAAIVLSTIPHRVMSLNSVSPVCELSVIENDKLYSYSLATPIPNFPHGVLSEDGYSSTLSLLFLSFSWSGYSLLFIVFKWNGNVFYYLIGMGLLGFLVLSWNMIWVLNIYTLLSYLHKKWVYWKVRMINARKPLLVYFVFAFCFYFCFLVW